MTPLDERYLQTHNTHKRWTYIPPEEFEPAIPAREGPQTYGFRPPGHCGRPKFRYRAYKPLTVEFVEGHFNAVHTLKLQYSRYCNIFLHLCLGLPASLSPSGLPTKFYLSFSFLQQFLNVLKIPSHFIWCQNTDC